jgi:DNA polymerase III sliding clamp (beta) subunit (PCNA family)
MSASDELQFNLVDQQKPMILVDKNDDSYKYVARPLIIN